MPTPAELEHWFSGYRTPKVDADPVLAHLHRVTAPRPAWPELNVMAFDHRSQLEAMAREAGVPLARLPALKSLLLKAAEATEREHRLAGRVGVLIDGRWGADALAAATGRGWWVGRPVEQPGSRPLAFDGTRSIGTTLVEWPREQVVKCLVAYHPDDEATLRVAQEERLLELWQATRASGHELLLEVIPPHGDDRTLRRAVQRFYNLGLKPEWWKLAPMARESWSALADLIAARDPHCRGVVLLGLNQPMARLVEGFEDAQHPIVRGFVVGRTIWGEPCRDWLAGTIDDTSLVTRVAERFGQLTTAWRDTRRSAR
jgi:5-dehydro-2-deoxygluconokinase